MADFVATRGEPLYSPRNNLPYWQVPTVFRTAAFDIIKEADRTKVFGQILDCVFEMATEVADANGVAPLVAIGDVCRVEHWKLLPSQIDMIQRRIEIEAGKALGIACPKGHLYCVEVDFGRGMTAKIDVHARHRAQVSHLIKHHGMKPCSINMIG